MVRGNWQKRVETAEARRNQARQRKQKTETASLYKQQAAQLLRHLDRVPLVTRWDLVVYTDTPSATANDPPTIEQQQQQPKRRPRSDSHPPKKAHPRSKASHSQREQQHHQQQQTHDHVEDEEATQQKMCRSFFFTGKCDGMRKGGSARSNNNKGLSSSTCRWQHLETLCAADTSAAAAAVPDDDDDNNNNNTMDCVYRLHPPLRLLLLDSSSTKNGAPPPPPSEQVTAALATPHQLKPAQMVYVVQNRVVLFDRYRGGWLFATEGDDGDDDDYADAVQGRSVRTTQTTTSTTTTAIAPARVEELPGAVLEHILLFLPDTAVGLACQVCRGWNKEIGSPALWRQLLDRHQWPPPPADDHDMRRAAFVCHSTAVRDVQALVTKATGGLSSSNPRQQQGAVMDFGSVARAPVADRCVAVLEWSPGVVLTAFEDNSVRLWQQSENGGVLRELIRQVVDPYCHTKKRTSQLVAVAVDADVLGCLCRVEAPLVDRTNSSTFAYLLIVIRREDFVTGDGAAVSLEHMTVLDVGQCVLDEILMVGQSDDVGGDRLATRVLEFVAWRDAGEVDVLASPALAALGHGRFLLHASVTVPGDEESDDDDDDASSPDLTEGRLVVISSHAEAVVWTATQADGLGLSQPNATLAAQGSTFAAGSPGTTGIVLGSLEDPVVHCTIEAPSPLGPDWVKTDETRPIIVSGSTVVALDSFGRRDDGSNEEQTVVTTCALNPELPGRVRSIILESSAAALFSIRDDHVVVVSSAKLLGRMTDGDELTQFVVIHVPTGSEVYRCDLDFPARSISMVPHGKHTLAMVIDGIGAVMVGDDMREQKHGRCEVRANTRSSKKKKKKKRQQTRGNKKDGFARGMSLRG